MNNQAKIKSSANGPAKTELQSSTEAIIKRIEDHAKATGLKTSTICFYAFAGNAAVYDRLKKRLPYEKKLDERFDAYLESIDKKEAV